MASTIKVNNIQNQCGANIANKCGSTITLGASGDTITLACGASQTGFGRTGTVDWDTTAKTASFTAVSGNGYFVNTTSGAITVTLPAGSPGDIVGISDYASTFQTNNVTITPNGTDKINGVNDDATLSTQGLAVSLVYVDATRGWKSVTGSDNDTTGVVPTFITATGGTVTCCGDYKIHTFTSPGTFTVCSVGNPAGSDTVDYLVVAGGGAGGDAGGRGGGGGGAGGYRESSGSASGCYSVSPLGACVSALPVTAQGYPITIGGGGSGTASNGSDAGPGSNSIFSTITAYGGGGGGACCASSPLGRTGANGGSGGGAGASAATSGSGGTGNTPPVSPPQGQSGGNGQAVGSPAPSTTGGGGGGATVAGVNGASANAGNGGTGATSSINGTPTARAGGGGGSGGFGTNGTGGTGGGGNGEIFPNPAQVTAGTTNTGGGGGAASSNQGGANGGSGIVIIRYKYQ